MHRAAVTGRLGALGEAVIAQHLRHAQAIGCEDAIPSRRLRPAVRVEIAPFFDRVLIAEEGERASCRGW